jgi:peptide/nickel transport system ATP-binding protein
VSFLTSGVRDLSISFRLDKRTTFDAVKNISFDIPRDTTVALVGESGSGKSVTSLAILGLLPPENSIVDPRSQIMHGGRNLLSLSKGELQDLRGADISMIFQEPMTSLNPVFTVGFQIEEVLRFHLGLDRAARRARAVELLTAVGISDPVERLKSYPHQMSGGQCQRVAIARAMVNDPTIIMGDEPTGNLDKANSARVFDIFHQLAKENKQTIIAVTHDPDFAAGGDRTMVMEDGRIVAG